VTLSIIIVNYNVKYFLEQCLCSVKKAIENIEAEVFVVDNNSSDGSGDYLKPKFPFAKFINNNENLGFSKANNKALALAKGKYILFLNPDTIVAEDSFEKCILFLKLRPDVGALGVKMIDGCGIYLKESKRGFPSPWVAFCKLSGLTTLFPRSKIFARYYLGYLSEKENQPIDTISGAFLFARKEVLDKAGGFDERFFMYAEDIDLSYRIQQTGYKNYYLSETTIIHFKGKSTKKDFHHTKIFYRAMSLFVQKHFSNKKSALLIILLNAAIWLNGFLASMGSLFSKNPASKIQKKKKIFFAGDKESKERIEIFFATDEKKMSAEDADDIIFCEGKTFTFKKIIGSLQLATKRCNYNFHSKESYSVICSNKKYGTKAFELNP
jgi:N-acetylglucosaminyl-diphospho-decaprenol L-rhamnosyltransferase